MKLLFRADGKRVPQFILICVFLLYLVAIGVLNIYEFSHEGTFWGLNPLPAFSPEFIVYTIVFYIATLVALILSVSSFFITRDKGFGIAGEKKEADGYEKMATEKDVKKWPNIVQVKLSDDTYPAGGFPMILDGEYAWVNNSEDHTIVIGSTGSGKTECGILPTARILAKSGQSMIITDPKGEIYQRTGALLKEKGYNIILINFRDPLKGNCWNPFSLPYQFYKEGNKDKGLELLEDIASNIVIDPNNKSNDPFWQNASRDYLKALAMGLFEDAPEDAININSLNLMVTQGERKIGRSNYDKEYFTMKGEDSIMYNAASAVINTAQDTKAGVLSTLRSKTSIFSSREILSEMLSRTDFDMSKIGTEKTAVFMTIHDEKKTYHSLLTIFVKQVYESLIDVAFRNGGKLPVRTNFLLDEFANMPALKDVDSMITASRSRNIRFTFIIQNFAQLNEVYGADMAETIKGNCNIHFLLTTELKALEEISKLCGEKKPKKSKKDEQSEPIRPLVTISDLQHMKKFEFLVKRMRQSPYKSLFKGDFELTKNGHNAYKCALEELPFPSREFKAPSTFSLIDFVNKKKEEAGEPVGAGGMMGGISGGMPFAGMGPAGFNPFMQPPNNMMMPNMPQPSKAHSNEIDFDALSKKIDAEIAKMENKSSIESVKDELKSEPKPIINNEIKIDNPYIQNVFSTSEPTINNEVSPVSPTIEPVKNTIEGFSEPDKIVEIKEEIEKPKVNVDADSIIVNDNVQEDEFFDDFFDE